MSRSAPVLQHVDVRVRERAKARTFYDAVLEPLGLRPYEGKEFTSYDPDPDAPAISSTWFGFTEDAQMVAGSVRISFGADSRELVDRVAEAARRAGALNVEGPGLEPDYTPAYYAVFFEDPDGNKLEVCCLA